MIEFLIGIGLLVGGTLLFLAVLLLINNFSEGIIGLSVIGTIVGLAYMMGSLILGHEHFPTWDICLILGSFVAIFLTVAGDPDW